MKVYVNVPTTLNIAEQTYIHTHFYLIFFYCNVPCFYLIYITASVDYT